MERRVTETGASRTARSRTNTAGGHDHWPTVPMRAERRAIAWVRGRRHRWAAAGAARAGVGGGAAYRRGPWPAQPVVVGQCRTDVRGRLKAGGERDRILEGLA